MKSSVAITLIISGTVLLVAPYLHSAIMINRVAETMAAVERTVNISSDVPRHLDTVCCVLGCAMIGIGAIAGLKGRGV